MMISIDGCIKSVKMYKNLENDTIAFRFCGTIIKVMRGYISEVKYRWMYKKIQICMI